MKYYFSIIFLSMSVTSKSNNLHKIYDVIKYVETNNNPKAIGDNGKAYGIVQIHKIAVDDVNRIYGTRYRHEDAFEENCAREIFELYLLAGIEKFIKKYNKYPTEKDLVRMWNGSIYNGYNKKSTIKYYNRYLKFKKDIIRKSI